MSDLLSHLRLGEPSLEELTKRYAPAILAFLRTKPTEHSPFPLCHMGPRPLLLPPYEGSQWDLSRCRCGYLWRLSELKHYVYRAMRGKANGDSTSRILRELRTRGLIEYEATRARGGVYRVEAGS